jgi:hypothetical protein
MSHKITGAVSRIIGVVVIFVYIFLKEKQVSW